MPTLTQPMRQDAAPDRKWGRIIVGVDDSSGGVAALRWAVGLARSQEVELVAVRAWALGLPQHGGRRHRRDGHHLVVLAFQGNERRQAAAGLVRRTFGAATGGLPADLDIRVETPEGDPGTALANLAANPGDLVVVGTQGGHILKRLVHGSVGRYCSRHTSCPVVVVGPDQQPGAGDWQ